MPALFKRPLLCLCLGLVLAACGEADGPQRQSYILSTASTGGTFYPVGVGLSTLVKLKLEPETGISLSAINSSGSQENVRLMRTGEAKFAILQGLYGAWAWRGEGRLADQPPMNDLRAITLLWQNVEHFIVRKSRVKTGTLEDLRGLDGRFAVGAPNSGSAGSTGLIFSKLGLAPPDGPEPAFLGYGASADALQNGTVAGMNPAAGVPVSAVTRAFATLGDDIAFLTVTEDQRLAADDGFGLWTAHTIPAGTYPGVDRDVQTMAMPNFLAVRADVPDEVVYQITRAVYENLGFLNSVHGATKVMTLERALQGLPVPLHPGARRYYAEQDLAIPAHLEPPG